MMRIVFHFKDGTSEEIANNESEPFVDILGASLNAESYYFDVQYADGTANRRSLSHELYGPLTGNPKAVIRIEIIG